MGYPFEPDLRQTARDEYRKIADHTGPVLVLLNRSPHLCDLECPLQCPFGPATAGHAGVPPQVLYGAVYAGCDETEICSFVIPEIPAAVPVPGTRAGAVGSGTAAFMVNCLFWIMGNPP
jgi:hypothetical protein